MVNITWHESDDLQVIDAGSGPVRRAGTGGADPVPGFLKDPNVTDVLEVVDTRSHTVPPTVRAARPAEVAVSVEVEDGAEYLLVVRQPSGALTFHGGTQKSADGKRTVSRSRRGDRYVLEFRVPVAVSADATVRRGILDDLVDAVVDAVVVKIKDFVAEKTVDLAEKAIWKLLGRKQGLHRVAPGAAGLDLTPVPGVMKPGPNGRALLLIHGTFSTTQGSFGDLATGDFFARVQNIYGDAIYGFEHFSVSVTPEQNAQDILKKLPAAGIDCDVITQSRGGLVLRNLVERQNALPDGDRFRLGRAALVASPNEGTPLATPDRWQDTVGWIANILDLFPPNPITSNAAMVARWITWFAKFGVKAAEGLDAMNMTGDQIRTLQAPPGPVPGKYSALVSNFEPDRTVWARALDLGIDWFFDGANDLVVPTAGGFRVDRTLASIPSAQIGVYGPGGNLDPGAAQVHHMNSFGRPDTQRFLVNALTGDPQGLPPFDPSLPLPVGRRSAGGALLSPRDDADDAAFMPVIGPRSEQPVMDPAPRMAVAAQHVSSVFEVMVVDPDQIAAMGLPAPQGDGSRAFIYAAYGGARVAVPFWLKKSPQHAKTGNAVIDKRIDALIAEVNSRRGKIFGYDRKVKALLDGEQGAKPLSDADLQAFGGYLFQVLMPDQVRRLYDAARSRERGNLFLIFTSMIPWVFDLPWELARDPERGTFLATEDVHFIRNVLTPTPVQKMDPASRLRMLVVTAEPRDLATLSSDEESAKLRHALTHLQNDGLIEFDVLEHATAHDMHRAVVTGDYDVLHFIGHGFWDDETGESGLMMEDERGLASALGGRALREILAGRGLRLVFLNACDTGRGRRVAGEHIMSFAGVAQDLFGRGVPNVIANQFPVGDRAAVAFARAIYDYLAHGKTIAQAAREARIAANFEKGGENLDWAVPVVYARDPEDRLVTKAHAATV